MRRKLSFWTQQGSAKARTLESFGSSPLRLVRFEAVRVGRRLKPEKLRPLRQLTITIERVIEQPLAMQPVVLPDEAIGRLEGQQLESGIEHT